jgi:flagellar M-ring protein FliF
MNERLQQLWQQLAAFFLALPPARRVTIAAVGAVSMAGVLALAWWVQRPLFRPLFTNLSEQDAAAIVEALRAQKVPFELEDAGRAVLVPAERLYELRLALASRGLPEGGGIGFEIFDKQVLGQTDFLQRLNYQRALQGELGRTIAQLGGVEAARVHLALPERSVFVSADRQPSASVVVKLAPGRTLARAQIDGIVHLVAASVEGLVAEAVTVVDEGGRMLTPDRRDAETSGTSSGALEYQRAFERATEQRIESMLGAMVGRDRAVVRVTATLDFARVERTEETYDPDRTALKSERRTREETVGARRPGGAPGVEATLTNEAPAPEAGEPQGPRSERRDESQNYEVSKVVSRTVAPVGAVKQLSVAVLIDGTYAAGDGGERTFQPRPAEELDRLKELVKSAIGFSETRGDRIEIASVPFQAEPAPAAEGMLAAAGRWAPAVLLRLLGVVSAAAMLLWVVRPLVLGLAARRGGGPGGPGELATDMEGAMAALAHQNLALTQRNPEQAARLVREWLLEPADGGTPPA